MASNVGGGLYLAVAGSRSVTEQLKTIEEEVERAAVKCDVLKPFVKSPRRDVC